MKPAIAQRFSARRFVQSGEGVTAVEFAMIAPPFIALLWAILQTALVFFAQQVLQTATLQAARQIMTGQAQTANMTQAQFQQLVCNKSASLFSCSGLHAAVQTFTTFPQVSMYNPIQSGHFVSTGMPFSAGAPGDVEVVQVFYQWPVWPGPLGFNLSNPNGGGSDLIVGTAAFRNEP